MRDKDLEIIQKYVRDLPENFDPYRPTLAHQRLMNAVWQLQSVESDLARAATALVSLANKITTNLAAGPDDQVLHLNPLGELQSTNVDRLIALRADRIEMLQALTALAIEAAKLIPQPKPADRPTNQRA